MKTLANPPKWRPVLKDSAAKPATPGKMGFWTGKAAQPSCAGITVMLMAYAKLTKRPFLIASVQRVSAEPIFAGLKDLYTRAQLIGSQFLPLVWRDSSIPAELHQQAVYSETAARLISTRREFHNLLIIKLADGRWVCVDPFMRNLAVLDDAAMIDRAYPTLMLDTQSAATFQGQGEWRHRSILEQDLHSIAQVVELVQQNPQLKTSVPLEEFLLRLRGLLEPHISFELPPDELWLSYAVWQPFMRETLPDTSQTHHLIARAEYGPDRARLRERVLLEVMRLWANRVHYDAHQSRNRDPHGAMLVSEPTRALGAGMVVQLRHGQHLQQRGRKPPQKTVLAADIAGLSGSDIVTYNAWRDVVEGRATAKEAAIVNQRLEHARLAPTSLLHPLTVEALQSLGS